MYYVFLEFSFFEGLHITIESSPRSSILAMCFSRLIHPDYMMRVIQTMKFHTVKPLPLVILIHFGSKYWNQVSVYKCLEPEFLP
jgi:hypothetical protein